MEFKFLAVNGDNVGQGIGSAIATDNHEELGRITGGLKNAHGVIEQWVQSVGGQVVTSSGDEGIYKVPLESFDPAQIDQLREQYSASAGTTVTVGIGNSMSEASKALIYGKLNDKDQIVEYDPHIEDYIADYDDGDSLEDDEIAEEQMEGAEENQEEMQDEPQVSMPADEAVDEHERLVNTLESPSHEDDLEEAQEQGDELEEYKDIAAGDNEAPNEETEESYPDEDENLMDESEMGEEEFSEDPQEKLEGFVDQDDTENSEDNLDEIDAIDEDGDGDIDDMAMQDETMDGIEPEDIEQDMQGEDSGSLGEIKQRVASVLMVFKENKAILEQTRDQNPEAYQSQIDMLEAMIAMAKMLNMSPIEDAQAQETMDEVPEAASMEDDFEEDDENLPQESEENSFEDMDEDGEEDSEESEEEDEDSEEESEEDDSKEKKNNFEKSEGKAKGTITLKPHPKPVSDVDPKTIHDMKRKLKESKANASKPKKKVKDIMDDSVHNVNKCGEMKKSKSDSKSSWSEKRKDRRNRSDRKLKGVHDTYHDKGVSRAGHDSRFSKKPEHNAYGVASNRSIANQGKQAHKEKLKEIKNMKKPNLPKSEKDIVKTEKK